MELPLLLALVVLGFLVGAFGVVLEQFAVMAIGFVPGAAAGASVGASVVAGSGGGIGPTLVVAGAAVFGGLMTAQLLWGLYVFAIALPGMIAGAVAAGTLLGVPPTPTTFVSVLGFPLLAGAALLSGGLLLVIVVGLPVAVVYGLLGIVGRNPTVPLSGSVGTTWRRLIGSDDEGSGEAVEPTTVDGYRGVGLVVLAAVVAVPLVGWLGTVSGRSLPTALITLLGALLDYAVTFSTAFAVYATVQWPALVVVTATLVGGVIAWAIHRLFVAVTTAAAGSAMIVTPVLGANLFVPSIRALLRHPDRALGRTVDSFATLGTWFLVLFAVFALVQVGLMVAGTGD